MRSLAWTPVPLLLVALAIAALQAQAAPPQEQSWQGNLAAAPATAGSAAALAFDASGSQIIVGTLDAGVTVLDNDFVRIQFPEGNVTAEADDDTRAQQTPPSPSTLQGEGKVAVAISQDGRAAVAGGDYAGNSVNGPNVYFYALPDVGNVWNKMKTEPVVATAVETGTERGTIVAVGTRNGTGTAPGHVTTFDGQGTQKWDYSVNRCVTTGTGGSVGSLAMSHDAKWLVAGTSFFVGNDPRGCVLLFDTSSFNPVACYETQVSSGAPGITAVSVSPDGAWFAAGTSGGRYLMFHNVPGSNGCPTAIQPAQGQLPAVQAVVAAEVTSDGSALIAADGVSVNRFLYTAEGALNLNWTADVANVRSVDLTPDGAYIVVGAANLTAFHRTSPMALWSGDAANALVRVAQPQANDIRIAAASGTAVRGFRLHWDFSVLKGEPEPIAVTPNQTHTFPIQVTNTGSGADMLTLTASSQGARGFAISLNPPQLFLRPGESANSTVTLAPLPEASAQQYTFTIALQSEVSGFTSQTSVLATLGAVPGLSVAPQDPSFASKAYLQGDPVAVVLLVRNGGNAAVDVAFEVAQAPNVGGPWPGLAFSRPTVRIEPGGVTTTTLSFQVPEDARDGTENVLNVSARTEGLTATTELHAIVNPTVTVSVQAIPLSKVVTPGNSTTYTIIVANNGSLRHTYRIIYCVSLPNAIPCQGNATLGLGGWSVAVDQTPFTLNHDESRSFQLAVQAPRGALPKTDKLSLQIEAISADPNLRFRDYKILITSVVEPAPIVRPTPGPEFAVFAAIGLAAVAVRRRW